MSAARAEDSGVADQRTWLRWGAPVAAAIVAADQLTKWWAVNALDDRTIELVWTLQLRLTYNRGGAFGLAGGAGPLIAVAALVAVVLLVRVGRMSPTPAVAVAMGLVIGGALGNLVDRAFRDGEGLFDGAVVDFIDLGWWPVFNLADVAVVSGAILLVLVGETGRGGAAPVVGR